MYCIRRMRNGEVWFGTALNHILSPVWNPSFSGHHSPREVTWRTVVGEDVIRGESVRDILETPEGEIWLALSMNGVARYDGRGWRHYGANDGLVVPIHSLARTRDGTLWAAGGFSACRFDGERWTSVPEAGQETMEVAEAGDGELFVGTLNGLRVFRNGAWNDFLLPDRSLDQLQRLGSIAQPIRNRHWLMPQPRRTQMARYLYFAPRALGPVLPRLSHLP